MNREKNELVTGIATGFTLGGLPGVVAGILLNDIALGL